ncbi:MAG: hypothetical protein HY553_17870 [Elusimicrobia bacterium]|nr:hypothetical protein [Elusimicrobiota bacterium]
MVTHEITLSFTVTPSRVRLVLAAALLAVFPQASSTQDVSTMELYYPPPITAVDQLYAAGTTVLARDFGNVFLGPANAGGTHPPAFVAIAPANSSPALAANRDIGILVNGTMRVDGCISLKNAGAGNENLWRCKFR